MTKIIILLLTALSLYKVYPYYYEYTIQRAMASARQTLEIEGIPQPDYTDFIESLSFKYIDFIQSIPGDEVVVDNRYPVSTTTITILGHSKEDFRRPTFENLHRIIERETCHLLSRYYENQGLSYKELKGYGRVFSEDDATVRLIIKDKYGEDVFLETIHLTNSCMTLKWKLKIAE